MVEQEAQDAIAALLSEFNAKLRDLEERQRLVKERVLLIGNNLVDAKERIEDEIIGMKIDIENLKKDIEKIKDSVLSISDEMGGFARKSEIEILERQFKIFQPLEFARIEDVKKMIKESNLKSK